MHIHLLNRNTYRRLYSFKFISIFSEIPSKFFEYLRLNNVLYYTMKKEKSRISINHHIYL
jgi:hypothetical protein